MRIEAYCTRCPWTNRAFTRVQDAPKRCPACGAEGVKVEVHYNSNGERAEHPRREHER
jgi:Zn finger protein HypA/HybF involved in hydrogenase expression